MYRKNECKKFDCQHFEVAKNQKGSVEDGLVVGRRVKLYPKIEELNE